MAPRPQRGRVVTVWVVSFLVVVIGSSVRSARSQDVFSFTIPTLPAGKSIVLTFDATITTPFPAQREQIVTQGLVEGEIGATTFRIQTDEVVTAVDAAPDLRLEKTDGGGPGVPGETLIYTLSYTNVGTQDTTGVC